MLCDDILGIIGSYVVQFRGGYQCISHEIEVKVAEAIRIQSKLSHDGNSLDTFIWTEGGSGRTFNFHPGRILLNAPKREVRYGYLQPTIRLDLDKCSEFQRRVTYGKHMHYFTGTIPKGEVVPFRVTKYTKGVDVYVCYPQLHRVANIYTKMFGEEKYLEERQFIIASSEDTPELRAGWIDENALVKHLCKIIIDHDCSQGCSICDTTDFSQLCGSKDHLFGQMHCTRDCFFM